MLFISAFKRNLSNFSLILFLLYALRFEKIISEIIPTPRIKPAVSAFKLAIWLPAIQKVKPTNPSNSTIEIKFAQLSKQLCHQGDLFGHLYCLPIIFLIKSAAYSYLIKKK